MPTPSSAPPPRRRSPITAACSSVDREHLPARRAEAAENRDGVDLPHDERVHAARDADAAEQQRDESDDREEVVQLVDRAARARDSL